MYGAPQTPTPVPVAQAAAEESNVVTSCYAQPERPRSSAGTSNFQQPAPPPQPERPRSGAGANYQQQQPGQHHGGAGYQQQQPQQPQHYNNSQQQHHGGGGGYPQQPTPLYHQPGPHPPPQRPQYEALQPQQQQQQPVAVVQFTSQHPQPQPQQQQHYQQVHLQPQQQQHPHHMNNHNQHYQQHNVSQHQQQQAQPQHHQIKQNSPQPPHPQQHNYSHQPQQQPHPQQQQQHPQKVVSSEGVRPQTEVMPHTAASPQPQMMTPQGQPQQVQRPQYYMTPGSVQQGPRLQGGQIRQWPTVRQQTPGGGQVVVRPSVSGGIQMVGAQPQSQKQVHQVITGSGQRVRPLIISGQHPGGQRDNIIRPGQHQGVIQQTANEQQQADGQPRAQMSHYQKKKLRFKKILCEICEQDSTTGKHFKVSACNACALFFRRTVRLNKRYNCVLGTGRVVLVLPDRFNPASFSWQKLKTWF